MEKVLSFLREKEDFQSIIEAINGGMKEQLVTGLTGSSRGMFAKMLQEASKRPILIVTHQLLHAQTLYEEIAAFSEEDEVHLYPVNELITSEMIIASPELRAERIKALTNWRKRKTGILIAPVAALRRILPPPTTWDTYELSFAEGAEIDVESYLSTLVDMGYERVEMVTSPAEFSVRGGILDIYPVTEAYPLRVELFDTEIDSIRYFDADTQRSMERIPSATIVPTKELLLTAEDMVTTADRIDGLLRMTLQNMSSQEHKELLLTSIEQDVEKLRGLEYFQDMYKYARLFYDQPASLLDYLPEDGLIIFDEMGRIQETVESLETEEAETIEMLLEKQQLVKDVALSHDWSSLRQRMTGQRIYLSVFLRHIANTNPENIVTISTRVMQEFHGQMHLFKSELARWENAGYSVVIATNDLEAAERVKTVLLDYEMDTVIKDSLEFPLAQPTIVIGNVQTGVEFPMHKVVVVTENELFKRRHSRTRKKQTISNAERIKNYQELKIGDYIVHRNHGIGKYLGVETLKMNKLHKDYLLINYSGDDKLYVPVDQMELVQKYVGSEGKEPRLYKLGGTEWAKVKRKVQSSVEDIADELIKLYAARQAQVGYAFGKDTELQDEFEHAFAYQETADQLQSIEEIKQDMEKERPMDRLLCGDVGYGKTEVAIRAAFKAVAEGKQVAILVPTTILAQQHYQTMIERFQDFAVNIGLLSRFRTKKQQTETIKGLENGRIDIVVGTHRILTKDVVYRDLGLLIVDEEQRFGVKHKERIKQIKTDVDVLTLTATPIPRTLHMSMLGIRDLSVIETPPENRFPVQTYVVEHDPIFIREAIEREIARGGQVFLLYNRVDTIDKVAGEIAKLVPQARISTAHGRMNETELENIMLDFLEGESDVLVSTTIIETGVDIPNVNTLIVYDADHMGLSQLYQLRGRVGRSNRVAYAYFAYRKDKVLTEVAEKRLQAIKEFTELGSGFKIAMRDLSIRGAGNLLGSQQHGFIDSVGFDLYSQMLKEAIDVRKEGKQAEAIKVFNPELILSVDAYIPETYITDEQQKIDMYKAFHGMKTTEDMDELTGELIDRFGDYPAEVESLLLVSQLRMLAKRERVEKIVETGNKIDILLEAERSQLIDGTQLFALANTFGRNVQLGTVDNQLKVIFKWQNESLIKRYHFVASFIEKLTSVNQ